MIKQAFANIFSNRNDRALKAIAPLVDKIESMEDEYRALSDEALKAKTKEFKDRLHNGETLDDLLPEAFAAAREAADRVLGMRPYKVQLIGGIVLHQGRIAEMKTGEGKTLVAVMPSYLNGLTGKGVHIVTVNDYLTRRDSEWMGKVHRFMGLSVGLVVQGQRGNERRSAYSADITYGTNSELGFDYLRDNIAIYRQELVQRGHVFAIVDEVDSVLIDEARTPLIISGQSDDDSGDMYRKVNDFVKYLKKVVYSTIDEKSQEDETLNVDYVVDEKAKSATLTARGIKKVEDHFRIENLAEDNPEITKLSHHINQALIAHGTKHRDVDYVVDDNKVILVDVFTGRLMPGRVLSQGLHQAIEAKEGVLIKHETKTVASITVQNYFRMYTKLSGMTGTALTSAEEFGSIYSLDIVEIPTNRPLIRVDHLDVVYKTEKSKFNAIIEQIEKCVEKGQPVLVGTVSIEKSEDLARALKKRKIPHNVLNATNHEKEAKIIAQAGKTGSITIATNMAGRGTDIRLGGDSDYLTRYDMEEAGVSKGALNRLTGNSETDAERIRMMEEVNKKMDQARKRRAKGKKHLLVHSLKQKEDIRKTEEALQGYIARIELERERADEDAERVRKAGGLFVIGTERHEARRIDNQLRGRAGRQGDPGETRFYISFEDELMRVFGGERIEQISLRLSGFEDNFAIDSKLFGNAIEQAQRRIESQHLQSRKNILEYDDVLNKQREIIYEQRRKVLDGEDISENIQSMISEFIFNNIAEGIVEQERTYNQSQVEEIIKPFKSLFLRNEDILKLDVAGRDELEKWLLKKASETYNLKETEMGINPDNGTSNMREIERVAMLRAVDRCWGEHIDAMDELRDGVRLRTYAQINPIDEYKREAFDMFEGTTSWIKEEVVRDVFSDKTKEDALMRHMMYIKISTDQRGDGAVRKQTISQKIGPNTACPCGKKRDDGITPMKYKKCCGRGA